MTSRFDCSKRSDGRQNGWMGKQSPPPLYFLVRSRSGSCGFRSSPRVHECTQVCMCKNCAPFEMAGGTPPPHTRGGAHHLPAAPCPGPRMASIGPGKRQMSLDTAVFSPASCRGGGSLHNHQPTLKEMNHKFGGIRLFSPPTPTMNPRERRNHFKSNSE